MHESQGDRPSRPDWRGARGQGRPFEAVDDFAEFDELGAGELGLIARDLARRVGAEIALIAILDDTGDNVEVVAAWGGVSGRDGLALSAADGFVGRVLSSGHAAIEPLDPDRDNSLGISASGTRLTYAAGVAVRPPGGPRGALCAGFALAPQAHPAMTLWIVEAYARLASLRLLDPEALDGLLGGTQRDALTGCLNYAAILHEVAREIHRSDRHGTSVSCCFIDLDDFKLVNDRHGHLHGSRVLASIASALRGAVRSFDTLGRYGGDEFVLLLPDTGETAAVELAQRLRTTVTSIMVNFPDDRLDASVGVAQRRPGATAEALLADADEALHAAKAAGHGTVIKASDLPPDTDRSASQQETSSSASARRRADATDIVTVENVLRVLADFEPLGGASLELVASELGTDPGAVEEAWLQAFDDGLLEHSGTDRSSGEDTCRLSERGRTRAS